jgi:hypothetical protein
MKKVYEAALERLRSRGSPSLLKKRARPEDENSNNPKLLSSVKELKGKKILKAEIISPSKKSILSYFKKNSNSNDISKKDD